MIVTGMQFGMDRKDIILIQSASNQYGYVAADSFYLLNRFHAAREIPMPT